jgi:hypothetical protein
MRDTLPLPVEKLFRSARELEPSAADLDRVFDRTLRRRRGRPLRTAVLAVGAALAVAVGAAAATGKLGIVPGFGDAGTRHDWPGGGFVYETPLYAVADATVPHFGRVRLTYRRSSAGDCHGIQVFDELGSGVSASHRESCGDSSTFSAATLGDEEWILVHGRAPEKTEQVLLRAHGRDPSPARLIRNAGEVPYVAFLIATPREGLCDVRVSAVGGGLVDVGGMDVQSAPPCNSAPRIANDNGP